MSLMTDIALFIWALAGIMFCYILLKIIFMIEDPCSEGGKEDGS